MGLWNISLFLMHVVLGSKSFFFFFWWSQQTSPKYLLQNFRRPELRPQDTLGKKVTSHALHCLKIHTVPLGWWQQTPWILNETENALPYTKKQFSIGYMLEWRRNTRCIFKKISSKLSSLWVHFKMSNPALTDRHQLFSVLQNITDYTNTKSSELSHQWLHCNIAVSNPLDYRKMYFLCMM